MNAELLPLIERLRGARVAVVGDLVADEFVYGETERVSREAPVLIVRYESSEVRPGCAANAAANLCALGARVHVFGLTGKDETGQKLRALLRSLGADDAQVRETDAPTATKTRVLAGGKNTRRQQIVRVDRAGPGAPSSAIVRDWIAALQSLRCDAVLVSDYGLGTLSPELIAGLPGRVCVDARYGLLQYAGASLVKPNEVELEQATGRATGGDLRALERAGRELLEKLRAESLLVTRGRSGMALLRPGERTALVPVHGSPEAVDVTGAGDTVMAATTLALAAGIDPLQAMRLANVAGSLKVRKPGTATVSLDELRAELLSAPVAPPEWLP